MNALKIGFIQATQKADVQWFKPLAFGYLKAYLDKNLENPPLFEFIENLNNIDKYNIIAISSTSQDYTEAKEIAAEIKRRNSGIITILGGHHVTYLPYTLSPDFDFGVLGEGEQTLLELVQYFQNHGIDNGQGLKNIKGLVIREGSKITLTGKRDLIDPLDNIPHPHRQANDTQYLFTSRGCPYQCAFCSSSVFWQKTRSFSAEHVVDEVEQILTLFPNTEHIPIEDDIFIINLPRLKRIIDLLEERQLSKRVSFSFAVRANLVTDELCKLLKRLKVKTVCFGAESGSDRILGELLKKKVTVAQNQKAINILHKHGITTLCSFIIGIPTETEEEVIATYEFVIKNILERKLGSFSTVNILTPMPGTEIWNQAIDQGIINISDLEWSSLAGFASYRTSNIHSFSEWIEHREKNKSIYLNERTLPQSKLYEIMHIYEGKIKNIERGIISGKNINIHPESELAHKYCIGSGLEIGGAAHNPFSLDTLNVDITDSTETKFKKDEIRLCGKALPVDIVASGDAIPLSGASQDFIVSSHVLEHFTNPIKALIEWDRLLKPGGIIFMIVPHKERTCDKEKARTTLQHVINDYQNGTTESNGDENGHQHYWITEDIIQLVSWMIDNLSMKWAIEEVQDQDDKAGNGFTIIIRKQDVRINAEITIGFGVLVNDPIRLDMVLRQSEIDGKMFFIKEPHSATSGLNKLLGLLQNSGVDVAALVHQDMFFQQGWVDEVKSQIERLPKNWITAGIIGKDEKGAMCGRLHDMRMPFMFDSEHTFPAKASCFDECCILVNLKSQFRFDERLTGFDLYGTLAVLQTEEMGGTAWIIDAFAEHYCLRPFPWRPGPDFRERINWIKRRFPNAKRIDSTVLINGEIFNPGDYLRKEGTELCLARAGG